jgi:hypothetical protein
MFVVKKYGSKPNAFVGPVRLNMGCHKRPAKAVLAISEKMERYSRNNALPGAG